MNVRFLCDGSEVKGHSCYAALFFVSIFYYLIYWKNIKLSIFKDENHITWFYFTVSNSKEMFNSFTTLVKKVMLFCLCSLLT